MSIYSRYEKALSNRTGGTSNTDAAPLSLFIRNKIARHEANTRGRDFIIGDLHGCVGYLDTLMRHVGFDVSTDRLFSVGDLVDRGPETLKKEWRDHLGKQQKGPGSGASSEQARTDEEATSVPVVLLARAFGPSHEHGRAVGGQSSDAMHFTLQIPAIMKPSGELSAHQNMTPWVARRYMRPNHDNESLPIVGDITAFDQYISANPLAVQGFHEVLQWCDDLWQSITDGRPPEGFVEVDRIYAVIADGVQGASQNLCRLYDALEIEQETPPLFARMCNGTGQPNIVDTSLRISALSAPRGTMSSAYGLADSQSDAVAALSYLEDGEILAVNGPPGTGKTTLLQSVIATMVVKRAIAGGDPAVIVGSSTNGQAVTNILGSMNDILRENPSSEEFPWSKRWVPDAETYGLHLPANESQAKQGIAFAVKNGKEWSGFPERENDPDYIQNAKNMWFQSFQEAYGSEPLSLESGLATLQSDIQGLAHDVKQYATAWRLWLTETQWWQNMAGDEPPDDYIFRERSRTEGVIREKTDMLARAVTSQSQADINYQFAVTESDRARLSAVKESERVKSAIDNLRHLKLSIGKAMLPQGGLENFCYLSLIFRSLFHQRRALRMEAFRDDARCRSVLGRNALPEGHHLWADHINALIASSTDELKSASASYNQTIRAHKADTDAKLQHLENAKISVSVAQQILDETRKTCAERIAFLKTKKESLDASRQAIYTFYDHLCQRAESEFQVTVKPLCDGQEIRSADFDAVLDRTIRHACFQKAMRYWEGRWIIEAERLLTNEQMKKAGLSATEARFRRWCMLTPCLVSTAHSMPKHFQYTKPIKDKENNTQFDHPFLWSYIDLLIVDEAGQVGPHIGAAIFSLAKRAVVVGDIYQIEPVVTATSGTDYANAVHEGLAHLWEDGNPITPHIASEPVDGGAQGSIMRLAQSATKYVSPGTEAEPGVFLSEHRRCRTEIISYCNDLIYGGRLQPLSNPRNPEPPVRPMAYAHVRGEERKSGGSRSNPMEAMAIAQWIAKNREAWIAHYGKPIEEIVAVVTPFKPQESELRKAMKAVDTSLAKVTAGTVHKLQGAERQIVVFSPVYQHENAKGLLFFDRKPNMLNVAVSRAKDSFVVIGDVRIFDRKGSAPSALLGKYLFADEENELQDVNVNVRFPAPVIRAAKRLSGLEPHREFLRQALTEAISEEVIIISSPWVKESAIKKDRILEIIRSSILENRVKVFILIDKNRLEGNEGMLVNALRDSGASVSTVDRLHSKVLIRGRGEIVEGSFNWFSAVRYQNNQYANYESSLWLSGEDAREAIRHAIGDIKRSYNLDIPIQLTDGGAVDDVDAVEAYWTTKTVVN